MSGLTKRQQDVFDFIVKHIKKHGVAPTISEISDAMGIKSKNQTHKTLLALRDRGYITWRPKCARSISVLFTEDMQPDWETIARMLLLQNRDMRAALIKLGAPYKEPEGEIDVE